MALFNRAKTAADPTQSEIIDAIRATPVVADALAAVAARRVAERQALVDRLAAMETSAGKTFPAKMAATDAAVAAQRRAEEALLVAKRAVDVTMYDRTNAAVARDRMRQQIEAQLRDGADNEVIDEFIEWARGEAENSRRTRPSFHESSDTDEATRITTTTTTASMASILKRAEASSAAAVKAENLRFLPDQTKIPAAIAALKATIPPIVAEVTVTTAGQKQPTSGLFRMMADRSAEAAPQEKGSKQ